MNAPMTAPKLYRRADSLGTENAFVVLAEVNALVREGRDIVSFCIGQPDFPTPVNVQDAAIAAIRGGRHGYTPSAGIDELRVAAARDMGALRALDIRADDVVVGAGAKPFIAYTIASVTDHGAGDRGPSSPSVISDETGMPSGTVRPSLRNLLQKGYVKQLEDGNYKSNIPFTEFISYLYTTSK